ncbi:Dabb family protein [Mucilaginibacter koreensis]
MKSQNRRKFLAATTVLTAGAAAASAMPGKASTERYPIVHHVFFWLKRPDSKEDKDQLISGLKTLRQIDKIAELHIGVVAATEKRDVVDQSWAVSELMFFKNLTDQATYQSHPVHQAFIKNCSHLWEKVVVYDAQEV